MSQSLVIKDQFYPKAKELRRHFEKCFQDPKKTAAERFVWDYWHVPDQYTLLRTPAYHFFPKKMYENLHRFLVMWGRKNLGCHDISPPWLSCYVDGCEQKLHGDLPHGPWAFVYSLTPWSTRQFTGGETLLLKEDILSYWNPFKHQSSGLEHPQIFKEVPANFNRLTVFDPRIPHGVKRVEGVRDVCAGRLVVHGWFVEPKPVIEGPLSFTSLGDALNDLQNLLSTHFTSQVEINGLLSLRFGVSKAGKVSKVQILSNTIRAGEAGVATQLVKSIREYFENGSFGKQRGTSAVTVPFTFQSR
jgi:hypothetical protein